ncbi:MAG: NADH-quinone oxidoreductase subunit NuoH [Panacagrimonas sp.]
MFAWITPELLNIGIQVFEAIAILLVVTIAGALMTWAERRLLGLWQDRLGPNRVWFLGVGIVVADMVKSFFKEDWTPPFADKTMYWLAPAISMAMMMLGAMIVPITPNIGVADGDYQLGILIFLAIAGLAVYAVMLGGWASNSKYSLLGGLRSTAQTITYEVFMGISIMGVVMQAGSFNLRDIVEAQRDGVWNVIPQILGFAVFSLAAIATTHRTPFDLPEAEQELAAGYHTEYSSMKFALFMISEYVGITMVSMIVVVLFFGGWDGPFVDQFPILGLLWFSLKCLFFMFGFILIRAALPRPRYDHMMSAGWKVCLPLALVNMMVTGLVLVANSSGGAS